MLPDLIRGLRRWHVRFLSDRPSPFMASGVTGHARKPSHNSTAGGAPARSSERAGTRFIHDATRLDASRDRGAGFLSGLRTRPSLPCVRK